MYKQINCLLTLTLTLSAMFCTVGCQAQPSQNINWKKAIYVSPAGNDKFDGTRDKPFATIQKALSKLPSTGGGVIALRSGAYSEQVSINVPAGGQGELQPLIVTSAPGEQAVFQGGSPITKWSAYGKEKGLYVIERSYNEAVHSSRAGYYDHGYYDIWENTARVRYRKLLDADGVRAYPGSACLLDDTHILVHTTNGRTPREVDLWRSNVTIGILINRNNVVLRGIRFENYLEGHDSAAIAIRNRTAIANGRMLAGQKSEGATNSDISAPVYATGIVIDDCFIANCVRGIVATTEAAHITNCDIREVGLGILAYGNDTMVENCVIQSAAGLFAISELNQHERNGIRYYFPASGGTVRNCVTAGFWTGVYIKSYTNNPDTRPILLENNIILDGIIPGIGTFQPKVTYSSNIIGPNEQHQDPMKSTLTQPATWKSNYFFASGAQSGKHINAAIAVHDANKGDAQPGVRTNNQVGENPFADVVGGDLTLKPGLALPLQRAPQKIKWDTNLAAKLKHILMPRNNSYGTLKFTQPPLATASRQGALISVHLSIPAKSTLHYRKAGADKWQTATGIDNAIAMPKFVIGSAPVEQKEESTEQKVLFVLLDGKLEPNAEYEYFVEAKAKDGSTIRSEVKKLRAEGEPKKIYVRENSDTKTADGTIQHPFAQLQEALDRALPGDTIQLEKGVYTAPVVLVHGGTAQAPLTIQGMNSMNTIFDSGMEAPCILQLRDTSHVAINDVQIRWFGNDGISATNSSYININRCRFVNAQWKVTVGLNGRGVTLSKSPHCSISHCMFVRMETGILAQDSPQLRMTNNTAFGNVYGGAELNNSAPGSVITGNTFNFTGNDSITLREPDMASLETLVCDDNNYGTLLSDLYDPIKKVHPENEIKPNPRYGLLSRLKGIVRIVINGKLYRFRRMEDWREFSGKDMHSIFADPQFIDPLKGDFRLMPDSPNILPDNKIIGAYPVATELN